MAGIITFVLSVSMTYGLIHFFGPKDRYGGIDPAIYDIYDNPLKTVLAYVWETLAFVVTTIAIIQIFRYYRRLKFREKFVNWLHNFFIQNKP
jgi:hypothetical protein